VLEAHSISGLLRDSLRVIDKLFQRNYNTFAFKYSAVYKGGVADDFYQIISTSLV